MTIIDDRRAAVIRGLRDLADFLETHPEVPVSFGANHIAYHARGTDEAKRADIDRIAKILGVTPTDHNGHYDTRRQFGAVAYEACAIQDAVMEQYNALQSYDGSVQPAQAGADR